MRDYLKDPQIFDYVNEDGEVLVTGTIDEISKWESENFIVKSIEPFIPPKDWDGQFHSSFQLIRRENDASS